jgi:hypothetical protein
MITSPPARATDKASARPTRLAAPVIKIVLPARVICLRSLFLYLQFRYIFMNPSRFSMSSPSIFHPFHPIQEDDHRKNRPIRR